MDIFTLLTFALVFGMITGLKYPLDFHPEDIGEYYLEEAQKSYPFIFIDDNDKRRIFLELLF